MFKIITSKKSLFPILFGCLFAQGNLAAQAVDVFDPYKEDLEIGYKNLIKTNAIQPFIGVYGVAWERWLNQRFSGEVSGSLLRTDNIFLSESFYGMPLYGRPGGTGYHFGLGVNALFDESGLGDVFGLGFKVDYRNFAKIETPSAMHIRGLSTALYIHIQNDYFDLFVLDYRVGGAFHHYRFTPDRTRGQFWFFLNFNIGFPF
jgi:hypothetical protein